MYKILNTYTKTLEIIIAVLLGIMVILVFGNVVLRYGFNSGIIISEELSRWMFIWVTFLGSIAALHKREHLGTTFVLKIIPYWAKRLCLAASHIIMIYICWLLFEGSLAQTIINMSVAAPITGASVGIFYASGIVFSVSGALILFGDLLTLITGSHADIDKFLDQGEEQI